jgi:hypothetical protein
MGYELHITKKQDWFDETSDLDITLDEWKQLVAGDPDMRMDNYAEATVRTGETLRVYSEGLTVWTKYSRNGIHGNYAWFDYQEGNIVVKNPDKEIIRKMWQIAQVFHARVQGDDSEYYDEGGNQIPEVNPQNGSPVSTKKPWWKLW